MVSGQPGPMQQGPYPMYQPVYQAPHKPMGDYLKPIVSDFVLAVAVVVGLFLMWLGSLIWGSANTSDGINWGLGVKSFGMLILSLGLFLGGLLRNDMEKWVRLALVISGTLLVAFVGFWSSSMWWGAGLF